MIGTLHALAGAQPYAWPFDAPIQLDRLALVVAGWDEHWRERATDADAVTDAVSVLCSTVRRSGGAVAAVSHPVIRTGAGLGEPSPPLPLDGAEIVHASGTDGFAGSRLDHLLRRGGRTHLLVCGLGLEAPVQSTLRSANDRGYECLLVTDASAPLDRSLVASSISTVTLSFGIFGAVATTDHVVASIAAATSLTSTAADVTVGPHHSSGRTP